MIRLFLDTSYKHFVVSIFQDEKKLFYFEEENKNDLSMRLLPVIEEAFNNLKLKINDIEKIYVVNGPGSFTGLRIGVAVAKTLAWSLDIGAVPISEIEFLATSKTDKKYIVPLMDARRGYVFAGMYDQNGKRILKERYTDLEEFLSMVSRKSKFENVCFVSYDTFDKVDVIEPVLQVEKIISRHLDDEEVNAHILIPDYLKKTEAEEKREND